MSTLDRIEYVGGKHVAHFSDGSTVAIPEGFQVDVCLGLAETPAGTYRFCPIGEHGPRSCGMIVQASITKPEFVGGMQMLEWKYYPERYARPNAPGVS